MNHPEIILFLARADNGVILAGVALPLEAEADDAEIATSTENALKIANSPHIAVIGGAEIYKAFLDRADRIELTEVHIKPKGDIKMPAFDDSVWEETVREDHEPKNDKPGYSFVTLKRKTG